MINAASASEHQSLITGVISTISLDEKTFVFQPGLEPGSLRTQKG